VSSRPVHHRDGSATAVRPSPVRDRPLCIGVTVGSRRLMSQPQAAEGDQAFPTLEPQSSFDKSQAPQTHAALSVLDRAHIGAEQSCASPER
jgi:hypothetical protein